jgi:anthranilate synthase component 1
MYYPSLEEFLKKAKRGDIVPVYREIMADIETPVSVFLKLDKGEYSFLLESVEGGEKLGRYSFIGCSPHIIFKVKNKEGMINEGGKEVRIDIEKDPLEYLKNILPLSNFMKDDNLPDFCGGAVGYIGYDYIKYLEDIPDKNIDDLNLPDLYFLIVNEVVIFDHLKHIMIIVSNVKVKEEPKKAYQEAIDKIEMIAREISKPLDKVFDINYDKNKGLKIESNCKKEEFINWVKKAKEYIVNGDIFQVVLSQRIKVKSNIEPFKIYRNLRRINPSPYMFYLKLKDIILIGSSPELLVKYSDKMVETRPIAGTRARGRNSKEDDLLEKELLSDSKECAEHIMLIDLGRNDIGKVCQYNSITLPEFMTIEKYSHVMHIVTSVKGKIAPEYDQFDVIKACFPAGTVTGAPKIRAMEIIEELENIRRGPYAGCICYFSFSNYFDSCITIRTILIKEEEAYIQAGAGIVADSKPEREYFETLYKAKALLEALKIN